MSMSTMDIAARRRALSMTPCASALSGSSSSSLSRSLSIWLIVNETLGTKVDITVDDASAGTRLDAWLAAAFPDLSRSRHKDLILAGAVTVDGKAVTEPKYRVKPGESIALDVPPPTDPEPAAQAIALDILYEDDALIVINKPVGLVVHPAPGNEV